MTASEPNVAPQLPSILDLSAAEPLARALELQLASGPVRIDGAEVERVSTPCLQVLAAAACSARSRGQAFLVRRPSHVLQAAITDLGLADTIRIED